MKNLRWYEDYSDDFKSTDSYLFKTFNRPKGFKRAEDPGADWDTPSDLCFLWAGTLGKLFKYSELGDEKKEVMRKYSIWIIDPTIEEKELFKLFEKARDNIWNVVENNGVPTVPTWKQLRILESHHRDAGNIIFERN